MRAGALTSRITLLEPVSAPDADGMIVQRYEPRGTGWANIQHRPGSEAFQQARMQAKDPATIAVPASPLTRRMTSEWRVETDDRVYEVKGDPFLSQDRAFVVFQVEGRRR